MEANTNKDLLEPSESKQASETEMPSDAEGVPDQPKLSKDGTPKKSVAFDENVKYHEFEVGKEYRPSWLEKAGITLDSLKRSPSRGQTKSEERNMPPPILRKSTSYPGSSPELDETFDEISVLGPVAVLRSPKQKEPENTVEGTPPSPEQKESEDALGATPPSPRAGKSKPRVANLSKMRAQMRSEARKKS